MSAEQLSEDCNPGQLSLGEYLVEAPEIVTRAQLASTILVDRVRTSIITNTPGNVPPEAFTWLLNNQQRILPAVTVQEGQPTHWYVQRGGNGAAMSIQGGKYPTFLQGIQPEMYLGGQELNDFLRGEAYARIVEQITQYYYGYEPSEEEREENPDVQAIPRDPARARQLLDQLLTQYPLHPELNPPTPAEFHPWSAPDPYGDPRAF